MAKPQTTIEEKVNDATNEVMAGLGVDRCIIGREAIMKLILVGFNRGMKHSRELMGDYSD